MGQHSGWEIDMNFSFWDIVVVTQLALCFPPAARRFIDWAC